jgi:hypothetical protein
MDQLNHRPETVAEGTFVAAKLRGKEEDRGSDAFAPTVLDIAADTIYELDVGPRLAAEFFFDSSQVILDQLVDVS